jgi:hypothetical protein
MPLKRVISELHKNHKKSVSENLKWFKDSLEDKKSMEVYKVPANQYLKPGKIYRFYYNPITAKDLPYYDVNPLVLSLGTVKFKGRKVDLCLNLNYFPYDVKVYIINTVYKAYKNILESHIRRFPLDAKRQDYYLLSYDILKELLNSVNINFGIKNYIREYRYKTTTISYDNFYRLPFIEEYNFKKLGVKQVHSIYRKTFKK